MSRQQFSLIGLAVVLAALAIFAFTRQQESASREATALANANAAATSQAESEAGYQTAVAQANTGATAQADAESVQADAQHSEATAVAQANAAMTVQAEAESAEASAIAQANAQATAQAEAQDNEATAIAQANAAMTTQANAETTRSAAVESAQEAATAVQHQAATATVAMGQAIEQAEIAQTQVSIADESAAIAIAQQEVAQATGTAIREENLSIRETATMQASELDATRTALTDLVTTLQAPLAPTATPILPTAVPTVSSDLSPYPVPLLGKTFTYSDGSLTVKYPAWWTVDEVPQGSVSLSSPGAEQLLFGGAQDQIFLSIGAAPTTALQGMPLETMLSQTSSAVGNAFGQGTEFKFGEPEQFQLSDYEAARIIGHGEDFDMEILAFEKGEGVIIVVALCGSGNINRCEPTVYAIAETAAYVSKNAKR